MPQITINVNGRNYTVGYDGTFYSPQGMLIALNNLGFGIFYIAVDGSNNYLTTVDNTNFYGDITTSADPITMTTNASCSGAGFDGQGVIDVTQFVGGDGFYSYIAIGNTTGEASANVQNPLTRDEIFGLGEWQFQDLVNGTYYVAIMDNDGNIGISEGTNVSCTPIPNTTTTTTTTTTAAPTTTTTSTTSTSTTAAPTTTTTTTTSTSTSTTTTTQAPTTSTTTTTTTAAGTFTANIATTDAYDACNAPELTNIVFTAVGDACNSTSAVMDATLAAYLSDSQIFYISDRVSGIFYSSQWQRVGSTTTCNRLDACVECVPASTTTSTTTTTTTQFQFTANIATTDAYDACNAPELSNVTFTANASNACDTTSVIMDSTLAAYLSDGQVFYISDRVSGIFYSSQWTRVGTTNVANRDTACVECPAATTSTTTTTTTQAPQVWYSLTQCYTGTLTTSTNYDSGTFAIGDIVTYSDTIYFTISGVNFTDPGGIQWSITSTAFLACPSTTTTTTTTTLPPLTFDTTPSCYGAGFPGQGQILADNFAGGSGTYNYLGIGATESDAIICVNNPACRVNITGETSHTYNSLANGDYWLVLKDSVGNLKVSAKNTVSCNSTTTSTTTTTLPPFSANIATTNAYDACNAPELSNIVFYGNGLDACDSTNAIMDATLAAYLGENEVFYVSDRVGGIFYSSQWVRIGTTTSCARETACVICANPTTSTTTTTTTPAPTTTTTSTTTSTTTLSPYDYYLAEEYSCADCTLQRNNVLVAFLTGTSIVTTNRYYRPNPSTGFIYKNFTATTQGDPAILLVTTGNSLSCNAICGNTTTTTTTTTTAAPTTTTSTTTTSTTITTSTTTTTTTLPGVGFGVSLNTKYGTDFLACSGTVTGTIYQKAQFGNTPTVGAQLYTSSTTGAGTEWTPSQGIGLYLFQFGGSTKWSVLVGTTGVVNTVTSCAGVSTTTTTTTLPPITLSISNSCGSPALPGTGRVDANSYSGGTGSYTFIALGTSEANAIACVNNPSCPDRKNAGSSAFWSGLANQNYWVALRDSVGAIGFTGPTTVSCNATTTTTSTTTTTTAAPTTTTTTSTTTSTTTLAPTYVYNVNDIGAVSASAACNSGFRNTYVWSFSSAFGEGLTYYAGNATAPYQPIQVFQGAGYYFENGGFVITIDDNGNSANYQPCPTTTTTTPAPTYSQYLDCLGNPWYTNNTNTSNGFSDEVPDTCVFYQNQTPTPSGTFFTTFIAGSCICP